MTLFLKKYLPHSLVFLTFVFSTYLSAAESDYSSKLINETNKHGSGFVLVRTRMWPGADCLLDTGKAILNPGEKTTLKIKKDPKCNQGGIGYEIYGSEDKQKTHLLGYLSHRFADDSDRKFSLQISRFCAEGKCVFADLNPEQNRKR